MDRVEKEGIVKRNKIYFACDDVAFNKKHLHLFHQNKGRFYKKTNQWIFPILDQGSVIFNQKHTSTPNSSETLYEQSHIVAKANEPTTVLSSPGTASDDVVLLSASDDVVLSSPGTASDDAVLLSAGTASDDGIISSASDDAVLFSTTDDAVLLSAETASDDAVLLRTTDDAVLLSAETASDDAVLSNATDDAVLSNATDDAVLLSASDKVVKIESQETRFEPPTKFSKRQPCQKSTYAVNPPSFLYNQFKDYLIR